MWLSLRKARIDQGLRPPSSGPITVCLLLGGLVGCTPLVARRDVEPLLKQPRMSSDSIVLDIFLVRFPFGDPEMNGPAWREIDEQPFATSARRRLLRNGFRAGLLAGGLPTELAQRLELADGRALPGEISRLDVNDLTKQPTVLRGHFQLRAGARKELVVGPTRDKLHVLLCDAGGGAVTGKTYDQAQLLFAVKAHPLADGRVRLELVPEISHGRYRQRWDINGQGVFRLNPGRQSRVFEDLKLEAVLSPGHMLVMSTMPSRQGSFGYHFFSEPSSGDQRLLLIRLSQTQHDGPFDRPNDPTGNTDDSAE